MQVINAIVITGTPATGKSRLAKMLSRRIKNSEVVDVNAYAIDQNLVLGSDKFGSKIIDTKKLEATDYCGVEAARHYEKVGEFLSSDPKLLQKVMRFVAEGKGGENSIDLLSELLELMKLEKNFAL